MRGSVENGEQAGKSHADAQGDPGSEHHHDAQDDDGGGDALLKGRHVNVARAKYAARRHHGDKGDRKSPDGSSAHGECQDADRDHG